jgi:hypothetical protein
MRSLLARSGKQRITVNVTHEDGTERELELAIEIARSLFQNTPH